MTDGLDLSRREFMQVGAVSLLSLQSGGNMQVDNTQPREEYEFQGVADLMGPLAARPAPDDPFFDNKQYYWYRYEATDAGRYFISQDDDEWTNISIMEQYEDAFGYPVVKNTRNSLDLPSPYKFSEERYRYIENGTRIQDPEADSTRFDGTGKSFTISAQAGDTIEFKTAEAPRYIVGNDAAASWALQMLDALQGANDRLDLFIEGAYELRFWGDGTSQARTIEDGSENVSQTFDLIPDLSSPVRPEIIFNWYDVGRADYDLDYTSDNEQLTQMLATLTDDTDWISDDPIGRLGFRLDLANPATLDAGSMAYILQTSVAPTGRPKPFSLHESDLAAAQNTEIAADGYTVLGALRIDPERDEVFTTLSSLNIAGSETVDTEVMLKAVPPSQTDADFADVDNDGTDEGPAYPRQMSPQNSVLQFTPNVSTFPSRTWPVTGDTIPSGRLVGLAEESSTGQGSGTQKTQNPFRKKRPIYKDDVVLMIGHTPCVSNTQTVNTFGSSDQDW